jgi:hypothetical protein
LKLQRDKEAEQVPPHTHNWNERRFLDSSENKGATTLNNNEWTNIFFFLHTDDEGDDEEAFPSGVVTSSPRHDKDNGDSSNFCKTTGDEDSNDPMQLRALPVPRR